MKPEVGNADGLAPPRRLKTYIGLFLLVASVLVCAELSDVELTKLFDKAGAKNASDI